MRHLGTANSGKSLASGPGGAGVRPTHSGMDANPCHPMTLSRPCALVRQWRLRAPGGVRHDARRWYWSPLPQPRTSATTTSTPTTLPERRRTHLTREVRRRHGQRLSVVHTLPAARQRRRWRRSGSRSSARSMAPSAWTLPDRADRTGAGARWSHLLVQRQFCRCGTACGYRAARIYCRLAGPGQVSLRVTGGQTCGFVDRARPNAPSISPTTVTRVRSGVAVVPSAASPSGVPTGPKGSPNHYRLVNTYRRRQASATHAGHFSPPRGRRAATARRPAPRHARRNAPP